MKVVAIVGSVRKDSYNKKLAKYVQKKKRLIDNRGGYVNEVDSSRKYVTT